MGSVSNFELETFVSPVDEKDIYFPRLTRFNYPGWEKGPDVILETERDIATNIISAEDDPTLSPWTLRAFFIGGILSAFGGVLGAIISPSSVLRLTHSLPAEIYYFKPVSTKFEWGKH